jgi:hypothetical protein
MAAEIAAAAETGELILFHHDPAYTDDMVAAQEAAAQKLFPDSRAAYEGMEIKLKVSRHCEGVSPKQSPIILGLLRREKRPSRNDEKN